MNWIDFFSEGEDAEVVLKYFSYLLQPYTRDKKINNILNRGEN
jgi:hypothetical protein